MQTRRQFIMRGGKLVAAAAAATAAGPTVFTRDARAAGQLKILQWSHFVPAYDEWFDPWAKKWGAAKGIEVTVDHVGFADVVPRATAEVAAQSGHDIHMFIGLGSAFEEHVIDLTDVHVTLEKKYGQQVELAKRSTYNPLTKKQFALSDMWVPDPGNYHKNSGPRSACPNGPVDLGGPRQGGARDQEEATPRCRSRSGSGSRQDIDSNMAVRNILWCHGGSIQDKDAQRRPQLAGDAGRARVREAPLLGGHDAGRAQLERGLEQPGAQRQGDVLHPELDLRLPDGPGQQAAGARDDIFFTPALKGPTGIQLASEHVMSGYVVWKFSKSQDAAKEFLVALVDASRESMMASKLYNFPSFYGAVADPDTPMNKKIESGAAWIAKQCNTDPFGSKPADKLALLAKSFDRGRPTWATRATATRPRARSSTPT